MLELLQSALLQPERYSINALVEHCYKVALSYFRVSQSKLRKRLNSDSLSLSDLAIDAIAPLFEQNQNGIFFVLKRAYDQWDVAIDSDEEANFFLSRVISQRVAQTTSKYLRESDPFFSKILSSLMYFAKKEGFVKVHSLGTSFLVPKSEQGSCHKWLRAEEMGDIDVSGFFAREPFLQQLLHEKTKQFGLPVALPTNVLVLKIKDVAFVSNYRPAESDNLDEVLDIEVLAEEALHECEDKLIDSYLDKGKLTEAEYKAFRKALKDIIRDIVQGGIHTGLYEYLKIHLCELDRKTYYDRFHNSFEYLVRVMKNHLIKNMQVA